jgi:two-component system response regulator YesN
VAAEASDGTEALGYLESRPVDLVLTDVKMPEMDGLALAKVISERWPRTKVVVISGYDEFAYANEAIRYGVREYLLKPVLLKDLTTCLNKLGSELEEQINKEYLLRAMQNLSIDYKRFVIKNLVRALINSDAMEVKSLYPLAHKLGISFIDSTAAILVIAVDETVALLKLIPPSDIVAFQMILSELAEASLKNRDNAVGLSHEDCLAILVTGDSET